ncbi:MAG: methionine adenosyltransferase [Thaumarchaeota archaeon]|nr:methionine adenosyltransferase [Nitrososphaerota archaeon]
MSKRYSLTSESVTEGHPDKVSDQISDAILDAVISEDKDARVDCETMIMQGTVLITGQITTTARVNYSRIARMVLKDIGLDNARDGIDWNTCGVFVSIEEQPPDIAMGVNKPTEKMGAGDQGIMYGYATSETPELMPLPIQLAHKIAKKLSDVRKNGILTYLRPDGKSQVTVDYEDDRPARVRAVVVAAQHSEEIPVRVVRKDVIEKVVKEVIPAEMIDSKTKFYINETGRFVIGGTRADTGITGRKIMVDTYGSFGSHGGGCFSGKDPTKVDRSGAYVARYVAKNLVASGLAKRCSVQLAYAIGVAQPVSVILDTSGTGTHPDDVLLRAVREMFDMRPGMIIKKLDLARPIYRKTSCYGHFGREEPGFTWERADKATQLRRAIKRMKV